MDTLDDKHTLAIGDVLSFRIVEDEEEPKTLVITDSGTWKFLHRAISAENRTASSWPRNSSCPGKEYYYQATVIIAVDSMAKSRGKVYLSARFGCRGRRYPSDEVFTLSKAFSVPGLHRFCRPA